MNLTNLKKFDVFKIVDFDKSCEEMKQRLSSMGVKKGTMGQIIHKMMWGPIEIEFNNSKIAIGRGMAKKIKIQKYECPLFEQSKKETENE